MHGKSVVIEHKTFMDTFTSTHPLRWRPKDFIADIPTPTTENEMYATLPGVLNKWGLCPGYTFVATPRETDDADPTNQAVDCGMYKIGFSPQAIDETCVALDWSRVELSIECKTGQDPFDANAADNEPTAEKRKRALGRILSIAELVFQYQQRTCHFMILFLGDFARIVRFDRSTIFATAKFNYKTETKKLAEFLWRYSHSSPAQRGHDPTATRVERGDELWRTMMAKKGAKDGANPDYVQKLFDDSLDETWPWWQLEVPIAPPPEKRTTRMRCTRKFLVGKPHFLASGVTGRGTRGYVALPLDNSGRPCERFVYLKDAWRLDHKVVEKEGDILYELNQAKAEFVPTLVCHGDLSGSEQTTDWQSLWKEHHPMADESECPLKRHQHYRLVVQQVGKPLADFGPGSDDLVFAIGCVLQAHAAAYHLGIIHRDISEGNILLWKDTDGEWYGLLNDWELSKRTNVQYRDGEQPDRTGTWQFMSAHVLDDETRRIILPDELESVFHVLLNLAVRFLPTTLRDQDVGQFLHDYFDGCSHHSTGVRCGLAKRGAMESGMISLKSYNGQLDPNKKLRLGFDPSERLLPLPSAAIVGRQATPLPAEAPAEPAASPVLGSTTSTALLQDHPPSVSDNAPAEPPQEKPTSHKRIHPLNDIIDELLKWFQAYYALEDLETDTEKNTNKKNTKDLSKSTRFQRLRSKTVSNSTHASTAADQAGSQPSATTTRPTTKTATSIQELRTLASNLMSHDPFINLVLDSLEQLEWPENDKGKDKKPKGGVVVPKDQVSAISESLTSSKKREIDDVDARKERVRKRRKTNLRVQGQAS
ncbi:hypothetical protein L226DRAFT_163498 [Lentinus tigrinus ALCF2SS1-7]|uniref:Fungal-type protein kinase domain-containing protein n=1 Tax=Lentinus tigrinus ALCF2SS1-6 TaxID=1328759 RepID=A0A5C2S2Q9_9APHY|nr:hypothetical protein L227DRAFT_223572 [Lentinus tigrinus ALCF2SS1-6]RPD71850.1 hypothetical protein L226DRAFT_163498 [Lentinus tigrinus ALCF2SS1-7]